MTNHNQNASLRDIQGSLKEISNSLKVMSTVRALSMLYTKDHIERLIRRHQALRAAHEGAISILNGLAQRSKNLTSSPNSPENLVVNEQPQSSTDTENVKHQQHSDEVDAGTRKAWEVVGIHYRELKKFESENPHIGLLSQFLGSSKS